MMSLHSSRTATKVSSPSRIRDNHRRWDKRGCCDMTQLVYATAVTGTKLSQFILQLTRGS